jgi:DNA replication protein DnaC
MTTAGMNTAAATAPTDGMPSMIAYLTRVLKTPTIAASWEELAAQARDENWSHEEYLAALLQRQVADRESKGTVMRIRTSTISRRFAATSWPTWRPARSSRKRRT